MPDQRYDVSAKTAWNRNSPGSKREDGPAGGGEGEGEGKSTRQGGIENERWNRGGLSLYLSLSISWFLLVYDPILLLILRRTLTAIYIRVRVHI